MCGEPPPPEARRRFAHRLACSVCGEPFEVSGDPHAAEYTLSRPFWSDQFRQVSAPAVDDPFAEPRPDVPGRLMEAVVGAFFAFACGH